MKHITLIITFILYLTPSIVNGNNHVADETYEKNGILYEKSTNTPFNGEHLINYPNGSVKEKLFYKNGKKDGIRETFHENGQLFELETYADGKLENIFKGFYDNGSIWWEGIAKNNLRDGYIKAFFSSGELKYVGQYNNNSKHGLWEYFDENGNTEEIKCFIENIETDINKCKLNSGSEGI